MTTIKFLGTKGEIEESSEKHKYHSSLLVEKSGTKILIDYGVLHKKDIKKINPDALLITHAHPDHYILTKKENDLNVPVYLTEETLEYGKTKPEKYKIIKPGKEFKIKNFRIIPYRVSHSIRCPTIGFKIYLGNRKTLVYNPDLVDIKKKEKILKNVDYYIGDGSCIQANLVRKHKKTKEVFGHIRITTQINWCKKYGIKNIIFTHLGKETIRKEKEFKKDHPKVILAYDGMTKELTKD